jgi:hypothetical protein
LLYIYYSKEGLKEVYFKVRMAMICMMVSKEEYIATAVGMTQKNITNFSWHLHNFMTFGTRKVIFISL